MKDNQKTKKQLIDELDMMRQKVTALEIAGSLRDASKAQQEDNAAKPKRKERRSFQEEKLNFIIEQSGLTSWEWDIEHDRKTFNAIWAEKLGYTLEEFNSALHESPLDYFQHPEDLPAAQQAMKDCLAGKTPLYRAEYRMRTKTGDWKWMLALGKIIARNAEGKPTHMAGVNLDISKRKQAEEALRESEARYRALLEAIPDKIIRYRIDGTHLAVKMPSDYIATTQYDLANRPNITQINPEMAPRVLSCLQQAVETGKTQVFEYEAMRGDEKEYREARYTAINQDEVVAIIRDTTGRKRAEEALRQSEERYRLLAETSPDMIFVVNPDCKVAYVNNIGARSLGRQISDIIGNRVEDFFPTETATRQVNNLRKVFENGQRLYIEATTVFQGKTLWLDSWLVPIKDAGGSIVSVMGVSRDITDRKQAEEALRESERRYRGLFESANLGIFQSTLDGKVIEVNPEFARIFGYESPEDVVYTVEDVATGLFADPQRRAEIIRLKAENPSLTTFENLYRRKDGSTFLGNLNIQPIMDADSHTLYFEGFIEDITERKQAEEALRESEERFRTLVENIPGEVYRCLPTPPWRIIHNSAKNESIIGYLVSDFLEGSLLYSDFILSEDLEMVNSALEAGIACKKPYFVEYRIHHADGSPHWVAERGCAVYSEQGEPLWLDGVIFDITERKQAEDKLRESESQYRELFNNISSGVAIYEVRDDGNDFIFKDFNKAGERIDGDRKEDVLGKSIFEVRPGIKEFGLLDVFKRVWKTGVPEHFSAQYYQDNRLSGWYENYIYMLPTGEIVAVYDNVTENIMAEQALQASENKYRLLVDNANEAIFVVQDGMLMFANRMTSEISGYTKQELTSRPFPVFIHPDDREMVVERHLRRLKGEVIQSKYPFRLITSAGSVKWAEIGAVLIDWEGKPATLNFISDITERKQAEESIKQSEEKFRALFKTMAQGVVYQNADGVITSANPAAERILGLTLDQMQGRTSIDPRWRAIHEDGSDFPGETHPASMAMKTGKEVRNVVMGVYHFPEEQYRWININAVPQFRPGEDKPYQDFTTFEDITERKRTEEALRESEEKHRTVVERANDSIVVLQDGIVRFSNPSFTAMLGYETGKVEGMELPMFIPQESLGLVLERYQKRMAGEQLSTMFETELLHKSGRKLLVEVNGNVIQYGGKPADLIIMRDITVRKQAEEQILRSESELKKAQSVAHVGSWVWDIQNNKLTWSDEMFHIFGIAKGSFSGSLEEVVAQAIHPDDRQKVEQANISVIHDKKPVSLEYRVIWPDKTIRVVWQEEGELVLDETGSPSLITGIVQDITERKLVEEALRKSEEYFQALFEYAPIAIWEEDFSEVKAHFDHLRATGVQDFRVFFESHPEQIAALADLIKILNVNQKSLELFEVGCKEELITHLSHYLTEESLIAFKEEIITLAEGKTQFDCEIPNRTLKGEIKILSLHLLVTPGFEQTLSNVLLSFVDITERKKVEQALRESEEHFRTLVENIPGAVFRCEPVPPWRTIHMSRGVEAISGFPVIDFLDNTIIFENLEFPEDRKVLNRDMLTAIADKKPYVLEYHFRHADGSIRWAAERGRAIYSEQGEPLWLDGVIFDITERKRVEEALKKSEARFRSYFELPIVGFAITSVDKGWVEVNDCLCGMLGYTREELYQKDWIELSHPEDLSADLDQFNRVLAGEIDGYSLDKRFIRKDGEIVWTSISVRCVRLPDGSVDYIIAVALDITERKRAEEALREAQKLASIGTLAGGMAHEINTPLQVVTGITERIIAQMESGELLDEGKLKRDIATVNRCGWNIAKIVRSVLTYVREMRGQIAPHDLNEIVKDTLLLTEHQLKTSSNISVRSNLGRNLPPLSCERNQIAQVLINLLTNARDAMPNGGEITIRTRYNAKQNRLTLQVSDTGAGIPIEIREKIFDPFFTTKEVGQGTGLGLSIVFGVVKAHGGEIEVESAPKQGTTFTIHLPKEPVQKPVSEPRTENQGRY